MSVSAGTASASNLMDAWEDAASPITLRSHFRAAWQPHYVCGELLLMNAHPDMSDHSKYLIDQEVNKLLMMANDHARLIILKSKQCMLDCAEILKRDKILKPEQIVSLVDEKYPEIWNAYDVKKRYVEYNI